MRVRRHELCNPAGHSIQPHDGTMLSTGAIRMVGEEKYNEEMPNPESYPKFAYAVAKDREAYAWRVANDLPVDSKHKYFMAFGGRHPWLLSMPCGLIVAVAGDNPYNFMCLVGDDSTEEELLARDKAYCAQLYHEGNAPWPYWDYAMHVEIAEKMSELSATFVSFGGCMQ